MRNLTGPILNLHFVRHNSVVNDTKHGLIHFSHLTMQAKRAGSETSAKLQADLTGDCLRTPPMTTRTITYLVDLSSEFNTTGTVTSLQKIKEAASVLISQSMSTKIDKEEAVRVANTTESPYTIRKNTLFAEFFVVFLEKSKFIKPVDTALFTLILRDETGLTTKLNELP